MVNRYGDTEGLHFICRFLKQKERCVINMCKIRNLYGLTPDGLLEKCSQSATLPVRLDAILEKYRIQAQPHDFTDFENSTGKRVGIVLGALVFDKKEDKAAIYYKDDKDPYEYRFTVAHEIAHCCLENIDSVPWLYGNIVELREANRSNERKEVEADLFARKLLMPEELFKKAIKVIKEYYSFCSDESTNDILSRLFGVPVSAVIARRLDIR